MVKGIAVTSVLACCATEEPDDKAIVGQAGTRQVDVLIVRMMYELMDECCHT